VQEDSVIDFTRARFPAYADGGFAVEPLEKGGSGRRFYRISVEGGPSLIAVKYSTERPENVRYAEIAKFLDRCGVRVPHVLLHDADEGLMWMEDLGEEDLWSFRNEDWSVRHPLYVQALREVHRLHTAASAEFSRHPLTVELEFDEPLYLWEQHYFFDHCLGGVFGLSEAERRRYAELPRFAEMARHLASLPRVLVHRDFQSQNVMIRDGEACLIDFQGMRPGLAAYDVASLLYDPYVPLTDPERATLLQDYRSMGGCDDDFEETFHLCALQRLMQAMGAYGFLGLTKGRTDFLSHVPAARENLRVVASRVDGLDAFVKILSDLSAVV